MNLDTTHIPLYTKLVAFLNPSHEGGRNGSQSNWSYWEWVHAQEIPTEALGGACVAMVSQNSHSDPKGGFAPLCGPEACLDPGNGGGAVEVQDVIGYAFGYAARRVPTSASRCVSLCRPDTSWFAGLFRYQCVKNTATGSVSVGKGV